MWQSAKDVSQRSDSSGSSGIVDGACVTGPTDGRKMAAGTFNRDASFDDNQSDIYDDDDDRGFFQMNESDEGMYNESLKINLSMLWNTTYYSMWT